ncbi:MAG: TonB-dependent receptor [Pseudomonadota bacterium]
MPFANRNDDQPEAAGSGLARLALCGAVAALLGAGTVAAADAPAAPDTADEQLEEMVVIGERESAAGQRLGQPGEVLQGDELRMKLSSTLGDTISQQSGVHNASYGPSVGLPVLRGLSGVRVRASEGGIGAWDASALSPDHASSVEAVLAESIEIVRGPSTLRYGSGAIGGVVNVETGRIKKALPEDTVDLNFETRYEVLNGHHQQTIAGKLDLALDRFVIHLDGFTRENESVDIPGSAIDEQAVAEQFFFDASQDNTSGHIANTDADAHSSAAGFSYVADNGYLGVSVSQLDNEYGIPPGAHTEAADGHAHADLGPGFTFPGSPAVRVDLAQTRYDVKTGWSFDDGGLSAVELMVGHVDYEHTEFEVGIPGSGTLFESEVDEARLELRHNGWFGLQGEIGVHAMQRYFAATGSESFVPPSDTDMIGLFAVERLDRGAWSVEVGARTEMVRLEQLGPTAPLRPTFTRFMHSPIEYNLNSVFVAGEFSPTDAHTFSLLVGRSARAPDVQELISLGPHLATRTYSIGALIRGDDGLEPETFDSVDLGWRYDSAVGQLHLEAFRTDASDFIYQQNTGIFYDLAEEFFRFNCARIEECMPVYEYVQDNATMTGLEMRWALPPIGIGETDLGFELFGDYVRGKLDNGDDLPRMPPLRAGVSVSLTGRAWAYDLRVAHATAQDHPGLNETGTGSYTDLSGSVRYAMPGPGDGNLLVFLRGRNLLDEEIRSATSFLRNFAPEPGRSVEAGIRYDF